MLGVVGGWPVRLYCPLLLVLKYRYTQTRPIKLDKIVELTFVGCGEKFQALLFCIFDIYYWLFSSYEYKVWNMDMYSCRRILEEFLNTFALILKHFLLILKHFCIDSDSRRYREIQIWLNCQKLLLDYTDSVALLNKPAQLSNISEDSFTTKHYCIQYKSHLSVKWDQMKPCIKIFSILTYF